jgi:septal ring factor EnvC (AmiA/AmiB activator)
MPLLFSALILLSASLYILFRYSVITAALGATALMPSFADLKDNYSKDKKISKLKKESKSVATKARRLTAEEKKMQKESSSIEKQMEQLRREKESLAKLKQPKQMQLEKQTNRKVSVTGKTSGGKISSLFGG